MRRLFLLAALLVPVGAGSATASQLVDRNATGVKLAVDTQGEALITYTAGGQLKHVLAWGAVNAIKPTPGGKQVAFSLDYAGGYGKYSRPYWKDFGSQCGKYTGPPLAWMVAACDAPDGSYWALQSWQRGLPDYGVAANATQSVWELRLSHWRGELPVLNIGTDWSYRRYDQLYGTFTYGGLGVFGFRASSAGVPLDTYGRNIYVDTFGSVYGAGWKRENSFLTHAGKGSFCYGFYPHGSHPSGKGVRYRATAEGPGVAPDVTWNGDAPRAYDPTVDAAANAQIAELGDPHCRPN